MKQPFGHGRRGVFLAAAAIVVGGGWSGLEPEKPALHSISSPAPAFGSAGLKVHLDPATGRIKAPPAVEAPDPAGQESFKSSHEGLVEEPGTTPAGGFKVDAHGRFRSAVTVRLGPDGKPEMSCGQEPQAQPHHR